MLKPEIGENASMAANLHNGMNVCDPLLEFGRLNCEKSLKGIEGVSMNQTNLSGRIAVITGASRQKGIGAAVCRALAKEGADIFFTYWSHYDEELQLGTAKEPQQLEEELQRLGIRCENLEINLSEPEACKELLKQVNAKLGKPDILVNNACYSAQDNIDTINAESLDRHYAMNTRAITLLTAEFVRGFSKRSGGRIINMTTGWSQGPMPEEISYVLTKSTIDTLTYTLAHSIAAQGITINTIDPGPTDTGWMTESLKEELLPNFPSGRIGTPEDAARLICFLASDQAEWITGQVIHSDGGFL